MARRQKSLAQPPAGFMLCRHTNRDCLTPAGKVTAVWLRGIYALLVTYGKRTVNDTLEKLELELEHA